MSHCILSHTGSRSSHDLAPGKGELVISTRSFPWGYHCGPLASRAEEKGEGVFSWVFFIRCNFDVNHLTTTPSELQVISIGPPGCRSSVLIIPDRAMQTHGTCRQVKFVLASLFPKWSFVFVSRDISQRLRSASHGTRGLMQSNRPISFGYIICL